jgi:hypothetical protein
MPALALCVKCEQDPCSCLPSPTVQGNPLLRSTFTPLPTGITKEEFGLDLYEAIKTIGGILVIQDHMNAAVHQGKSEQLQELKKRRDMLRASLIPLMHRLPQDDVTEIVTRYPFVVTL